MATTFPSLEWLKALQELINSNPEYEKAAADHEGAMTMVIEPEEGLLDEEYILWTDPYHGKLREVKRLKSIDEEKSEFLLNGKYSVWKKIIKGEQDPMRALMTGKIKVKGQMTSLLKQTRPAKITMETFQKIETVFIDEQ